MALPLVGDNFRGSQDTKGFHRRNGRGIQDASPGVEGSGREAAVNQRWDCFPGTSPRSARFWTVSFSSRSRNRKPNRSPTVLTCSYRSMISQHIQPKWGDVSLQDVRPALVQDWLRKLTLSPKYKGHIRSLMYRLFDRAMIWELIGIDRNPMQLVEVKGISKRRTASSDSPGERRLENSRCLIAALPDHRADRAVFRFADQRNSRIALDGLRFQAVGGPDPAFIGRQAAQPIEDRMFAGRSSARTGFHRRAEEMARAVSRVRRAMALSQSGDRSTLTCRLDSDRLFGSDESAIGAGKDRVPYVPPHLSCVAGRNRSTRGRAAETHATRAHFHHDGPVRQCFDGSQTQSQSASGAETLEKKRWQGASFHSINKGNCVPVSLIGQFWTVAQL